MERSFTQIAQATGRPSIVVMDRGLCDVAAYVDADHWAAITRTLGWVRLAPSLHALRGVASNAPIHSASSSSAARALLSRRSRAATTVSRRGTRPRTHRRFYLSLSLRVRVVKRRESCAERFR